jgi:tRNA (cmo5U34)-methyltransferase
MTGKTGWQTDEAARRYGKVADLTIPGRSDILNIVGGLASAFTPGDGTIFDLGSGSGDVTEAVLQKAPLISAVLFDFSDEMIRLAKARFWDNPRIRIIKSDLNGGFPADLVTGTLDVVVSCFCLHHIEFARRVPLYTQIRNRLKTGGLFINGDRFCEESVKVNDWVFDTWISWMTERAVERFGISQTFDQIKAIQLQSDIKLGDKPGSLREMERDLRTAGFSRVDCIYKNQIVGLVVAVK